MSRLQFLMLEAVERGATLDEATDQALDWEARHPDEQLFEYQTHARWRRITDSAADVPSELASA